ncbi:MAG: helix-turn-helix domain-containing protein [Bacteroidia bacterium]
MISFVSNHITFRIAFPEYPVSLFVDHFVLMDGAPSGAEERLFPNNKSEIFFNLGHRVTGQAHDTPQPFYLTESVVSGTRNRHFTFHPGASLSMAGLRFTLFGFNLLFGIPAYHFTDQNLYTSDVWGKEMEWIREQLLEATTYGARIQVLHNWIVSKIPATSFQDVCKWKLVERQMLQQQASVTSLLEKTIGYSHKHSLQLIKEKSGLTPKAIQKVSRFDRSLRLLNHQTSVDWAALALDAGYADQSHFIREFRQFTGCTPSSYLKEKPRIYRMYEQLETRSGASE